MLRRLLLLLLLLASPLAHAQLRPTGLKLATPEQLRGVPLASTPYAGEALPTRMDLSDRLPPPGDQGMQNSCVGWSVAYALKSYQELVEENIPLTTGGGMPNPERVFSPSFIYNQINNGVDGGAQFGDALNLLTQVGAAPLSAMPYSQTDYLTRPSPAAVERARRYRADTWRQVNVRDVNEVKAQIAAGFPVLIGALVDEGLQRLQAGQVWQGYTGGQQGGHAMLVVGYDDTRGAFKLINSWGPGWSDRGFGWISYAFFPTAVAEGYVVKDATNDGPPPSPTPTPTPTPNPTPPAPPAIAVGVTNVQHNLMLGVYGVGMRFDGTIRLPQGVQGQIQVVIRIYEAGPGGQRGAPVRAAHPQFSMPDGQAATGTPPGYADGTALQTTWYAVLPYYALALPRGIRKDLVAEVEVFVNNFGMGPSARVPFFVVLS
jgi:hypothetical protein